MMKLGIMQPYFFPYLGYFGLIKYADRFILLDTVQYIRHGWINRNRVLKPNQGWQYIVVPVMKHDRNAAIKDIMIANHEPWRVRIRSQLRTYGKKAPYYEQTLELVDACLSFQTDSIVKMNAHCLEKTCEYLDISVKPEVFSELSCDIGEIREPGDWALEISKALGAGEYINPPGGYELFDRQKFSMAEIQLSFLEVNIERYAQKRHNFEPSLSILDVMMWNSPKEISGMLDNCRVYQHA